ncbi:saccharopine dehydrogenase C-terminal domain-containing protein [Cohaesibacter celericrescens]|uniref:saccharopine dehydrogenase C-terminal domain-containing protein n=1 Tax=Cohaesibacter celericrescens TaxID=2067669 RepID=UPI003567C5D4
MKAESKTFHWVGAGLASVPGIKRLIAKEHTLKIWERDVSKAYLATKGLSGNFDVCEATDGAMQAAIHPGDIVISMLPTHMHTSMARLCLEKDAHFVSSSYINSEMAALNQQAKDKNLTFINEVGLDPGVDHLLAHLLMDDYRSSPYFDPHNTHDFRSYCGGFPAVANDFKYKFSWSPLGVLKALKSPAKAILEDHIVTIEKPWDAVEPYVLNLPHQTEMFQSYPNRDSLPFMQDYGFGTDWTIARFVRGTLRLDGWSDAWKSVFDTIETTDNDDKELAALSDRLWADHSYQEGEMDRVVLSVDLKVSHDGRVVWHKTKSLDSYGTAQSSAMARLVSIPVSLAAEAILKGQLNAGVQAAPNDPGMIRAWLETIAEHGDMIYHTDHCMTAKLEAAE